MSNSSKNIVILTIIITIIFIFFGRTAISNSIIKIKNEKETEEIRNRPFPMAGGNEFGNDAGMETGDDNIPLLNREPLTPLGKNN